MRCALCGSEISENEKFCDSCKASGESRERSPAPPPTVKAKDAAASITKMAKTFPASKIITAAVIAAAAVAAVFAVLLFKPPKYAPVKGIAIKASDYVISMSTGVNIEFDDKIYGYGICHY